MTKPTDQSKPYRVLPFLCHVRIGYHDVSKNFLGCIELSALSQRKAILLDDMRTLTFKEVYV